MNIGIISTNDYKDYLADLPNNKVSGIWQDLIANLTSESLKDEANSMGFKLIPHPSIKEDGISKTFLILPKNASKELYIEFDKMHNLVSVIKE